MKACLDKQAMASTYRAQIAKYGVPISHEQYDELRRYAKDHSVRLSGFRAFVGEILVIKTVIDDINEIAVDFPSILDERIGIVLELDYGMKDEDFATTDSGHIIHLNAACFANLDRLKENYLEGVQSGHFVQGTDWRAIARHETGHVVDNIYSIEPLELGMEILGVDYMPKMYSILKRELSEYSAMYIDGREIVSECFAGYYGKVQNDFANAFVKKCMEIAETARISSIHGDNMK